ncbi:MULTISPECIES: hypothetical protein [Sinorhizobium]|uniref:Transmembrane protein n=1 Tax=Sinorhizobium americanum TaxID=194963 RepID=A0A2S3YTC8_9HYPH|nr:MULTISPECIES: hypothetical protein [Sinorhizobium]PDT37486.1 hypothetical protein CO656_24070 [Sinorhizobium sp. FG01]POH34902.1 hypothetical protein ATY31_04920 [Sinorhizobium americanum]
MLAYRNFLLRFDAAFLLIASTGGMTVDIAGSFLARGPEALLLNGVPGAAIGFIEAHGLAFILGVMLWRAGSSLHVVGAAVHLLLGTANLLFWQFFILTGTLAAGYMTAGLHGFFVLAHLAAFNAVRWEVAAR